MKTLPGSLLFLATLAAGQVQPFMTVSLVPSIPSPSPVGRMLTWAAYVDNASAGTLWYRFRVAPPGEQFHIVRDYSPPPLLDWTASEHEGTYEIEVSVRNVDTGETATDIVLQEMTSNVLDGVPAVYATDNPMVFLYSAPPCPGGSTMGVQFESAGRMTGTPRKPCADGLSMNFYLAGFKAAEPYRVWHTVHSNSASSNGPTIEFETPDFLFPVADSAVRKAPEGRPRGGILLQAPVDTPPFATDLEGNVIWYYPAGLSELTRPGEGGHFFGIVQNLSADTSVQAVREFDLAGMTTRETTAARINEQLTAMGVRPITSFHHEAAGLPDGKVLVLAATEEILTDVQGPGEVDVIGDMILVLDRDLQVVWTWDAFEHLDPARLATLKEICTPPGGGCPVYHKARQATDWLHGNSIQLTPDGNLIYSARHQDWLVKIEYSDGEGSGAVLWRLGKDGDFQIESGNPDLWFSHQHDASILPGRDPLVLVFDNGNVRNNSSAGIHSRGQAFKLDELSRTAKLVLNADLGAFSRALGSAQRLPDGHYHFNAGWLGAGVAQSIEVDSNGQIVYDIEVAAPMYRSFRMSDLYTP